jgi:acrylyl-CoA reductase (NADPH)
MRFNNKNLFFKALFILKKKNNLIVTKIKKTKLSEIYKKNFTIVKVSYSTVNHKDKLVMNGNPGLVRKFPHIPGIDAAGKVFFSTSRKFKKGNRVAVIARPMGLTSMGGLSEFICVPNQWLSKLPKGLSEKKSMIFGTAGYSAILTVQKIIQDKTFDKKKPILIIGSTTGVGLISSIILDSLKYDVILTVRNNKNMVSLKNLGFNRFIDLKKINEVNSMHIGKEKYSSIIDTLGGGYVGSAIKQLIKKGNYYLVGNIAGQSTNLNLMPFILRATNLIGINAENTSNYEREKIVSDLEKFSKLKKLNKIFKICKLKEFNNKKNILFGRLIVKIN